MEDEVQDDDIENDDVEEEDDPKTAAHTLCEPAQLECTSTCHKTQFFWKVTGKVPSPEPRGRLSVSLRGRNAQHVT